MQPFNKADEGIVEMSRLTIEAAIKYSWHILIDYRLRLEDSVVASSCSLGNYFVSLLLHDNRRVDRVIAVN